MRGVRQDGATVGAIVALAVWVACGCADPIEGRGEAWPLDDDLVRLRQQHDRESDPIVREQLAARLDLLSSERRPLPSSTTEADPVNAELRRILRVFEADSRPIPPAFVERVRHYVDEWSARPALRRRVWRRRQRHWPEITRVFAEERVPVELAYVAWVESHFDPRACSVVGARGMWQFMPHTARRYGLRVDAAFDGCPSCDCGERDERLDPALSTRAAARYLGGLLAEFGSESFMLALAAYNRGEDKVRRVLRTHGLRTRSERDFWHLYDQGLLPEETREYVPRVLAAAIVGSRPEPWPSGGGSDRIERAESSRGE